MKALQRQYPFPTDEAYAGAVPEPVDADIDETRASGLTLPELLRVEVVAGVIRRAVAAIADVGAQCPVKREAVRALLRSAADV